MEDYDRIELVYLFETAPRVKTYSSLFRGILDASTELSPNENFEITYWEDDNESMDIETDYEGVAEVAVSAETLRVTLPVQWADISVSFSRQSVGFPDYESTPYLKFSVWIYPFKQPTETDCAGSEQRTKVKRQFAELHAQAADVLEPQWGFGRRGGLAIGEDETIEELVTQVRPPLYEYNVFRNETVEAIGRDTMLSAPAWYTTELSSGGVFMAVTEPPRQCGHDDQKCDAVAAQLGLRLATPQRYH